MRVRSIDHFAITVNDLERSLTFYRNLLGLREVERHLLAGAGIEQMTAKPGVVMQVVRLGAADTPGLLLDLQQYISPIGRQSDSHLGDIANAHLCFGVSDLAETCRTLKQRGVSFVSEPVTFDLDFGQVKVVFLTDPDGFVLELMQAPN